MALRKEITTNYGVKADYWRVVRYDIDVLNYAVELIVMPYISREVREQGNQPFESNKVMVTEYGYRPMIINGVENPSFNAYKTYFASSVLEANNMTPVEAAYVYLKNHVEFFKDAVDC